MDLLPKTKHHASEYSRIMSGTMLLLVLLGNSLGAALAGAQSPGNTRIDAQALAAQSGIGLTYHAREAAGLLGIEDRVEKLLEYKRAGKLDSYDSDASRLQLALVKKVMSTGLELRTVAAHFDREITLEQQALDKLTRQRDFVVAATNDINFLQLGILSIVIDGGLEQTKNPHRNYRW
ncbi:MAG: hypothetical protein IPL73_14935 [Candidatus Obscuribacter sp.]|nr:hypothetical protein [Candidatus Obscuribacter sp.]